MLNLTPTLPTQTLHVQGVLGQDYEPVPELSPLAVATSEDFFVACSECYGFINACPECESMENDLRSAAKALLLPNSHIPAWAATAA